MEANAFAPLIQFAVDRGCYVVFEQSAKSLIHKYRPLRHVLRPLTRTVIHGCRYGWKSGKQLTLYHNLPHADLYLSRPCTHSGHPSALTTTEPSGLVRGNQLLRSSAWYPRPFAVAIARAAWGPPASSSEG